MRIFKQRRKLTVAAVIAMLAFAGAAFAYFTSTGSGTGDATVGSSSGITLAATIGTTLYPGTSSTVTFKLDNPSAGSERLGTIHLASVTVDASHTGCVVGDFTMPDVVANQTFANGNAQTVTATGTVSMAAQPTISQDLCQGATVTLHVTST
jgi:hypothetical protein